MSKFFTKYQSSLLKSARIYSKDQPFHIINVRMVRWWVINLDRFHHTIIFTLTYIKTLLSPLFTKCCNRSLQCTSPTLKAMQT